MVSLEAFHLLSGVSTQVTVVLLPRCSGAGLLSARTQNEIPGDHIPSKHNPNSLFHLTAARS